MFYEQSYGKVERLIKLTKLTKIIASLFLVCKAVFFCVFIKNSRKSISQSIDLNFIKVNLNITF